MGATGHRNHAHARLDARESAVRVFSSRLTINMLRMEYHFFADLVYASTYVLRRASPCGCSILEHMVLMDLLVEIVGKITKRCLCGSGAPRDVKSITLWFMTSTWPVM